MRRCKHNLRKWKYTDKDNTTCDYKEADQTMEHLLECPLLRQTCSLDDLMVYNDVAKESVRQWIGSRMSFDSPTLTPTQAAVYCVFQLHYSDVWW